MNFENFAVLLQSKNGRLDEVERTQPLPVHRL